jgi:hypothetical protein
MKKILKMSSQNTTEVFLKHLLTKKVRIKAWQEKGDSATNMAYHASWRIMASNEYLAGPSVSLPWRVTGIIKNEENMPEDLILSIVFDIFFSKHEFLPLACFRVQGNHVSWPFFLTFLKNRYPIFLMSGLRYL